MKKLFILLLFIPFVFACSSDSDNELDVPDTPSFYTFYVDNSYDNYKNYDFQVRFYSENAKVYDEDTVLNNIIFDEGKYKIPGSYGRDSEQPSVLLPFIMSYRCDEENSTERYKWSKNIWLINETPNITATIKESALNDHNCRIGIDTKYN